MLAKFQPNCSETAYEISKKDIEKLDLKQRNIFEVLKKFFSEQETEGNEANENFKTINKNKNYYLYMYQSDMPEMQCFLETNKIKYNMRDWLTYSLNSSVKNSVAEENDLEEFSKEINKLNIKNPDKIKNNKLRKSVIKYKKDFLESHSENFELMSKLNVQEIEILDKWFRTNYAESYGIVYKDYLEELDKRMSRIVKIKDVNKRPKPLNEPKFKYYPIQLWNFGFGKDEQILYNICIRNYKAVEDAVKYYNKLYEDKIQRKYSGKQYLNMIKFLKWVLKNQNKINKFLDSLSNKTVIY